MLITYSLHFRSDQIHEPEVEVNQNGHDNGIQGQSPISG